MKTLKTNTAISISVLLAAIALTVISFCQCGSRTDGTETGKGSTQVSGPLPLNLSVYLDLSDRLNREMQPSQMSRDTAIVNHLVNLFIQNAQNPEAGGIIKSTNHMKVLFYPPISTSNVASLSNDLEVDLKGAQIGDKKKLLKRMMERFPQNLKQIYDNTLQTKNWIGSDVWDFFSSGKVDSYCIRKGYRNVMVILTDGYLFHEQNKISDGEGGYSYILPQTLNVPNAHLICKRDGLDSLEVLVLEVNPYQPAQRDPMKSILEKWFADMGVKHCVVAETDMPNNTKAIIDSFFE